MRFYDGVCDAAGCDAGLVTCQLWCELARRVCDAAVDCDAAVVDDVGCLKVCK